MNTFKKDIFCIYGNGVIMTGTCMNAWGADKTKSDILTNGSGTSLVSYESASPDKAYP